ncbi:MAG: potassium efflux system protein, partial [Enterobacterales bacterium]
SILTALSVSGFNVQNLALIAGAFSVGIGFGLQNIVSNFVSGIILLIERPVKPGDWVIIGTTEGFVKEINIRATRVLTFDKSDILIPNSEFISNQVTNLTLGDNVGRLRLSVGVAYGSDTDNVHKILSDIVSRQHGVINDDETYASDIVFKQFGDSSLEFEVRCYLKDIRSIIQIRSELHFEIDKQFRLAKIEIPFPQRDIHIKTSGLNLSGETKDD